MNHELVKRHMHYTSPATQFLSKEEQQDVTKKMLGQVERLIPFLVEANDKGETDMVPELINVIMKFICHLPSDKVIDNFDELINTFPETSYERGYLQATQDQIKNERFEY